MAKKKNPNRKHKFKYSEPVSEGTTYGPSQGRAAVPAIASGSNNQEVAYSHYAYVAHDMRRLAVIAVILIIVEIALWYFLGHTSLGKSLYRFF